MGFRAFEEIEYSLTMDEENTLLYTPAAPSQTSLETGQRTQLGKCELRASSDGEYLQKRIFIVA